MLKMLLKIEKEFRLLLQHDIHFGSPAITCLLETRFRDFVTLLSAWIYHDYKSE
jgi:hypothetical protein